MGSVFLSALDILLATVTVIYLARLIVESRENRLEYFQSGFSSAFVNGVTLACGPYTKRSLRDQRIIKRAI